MKKFILYNKRCPYCGSDMRLIGGIYICWCEMEGRGQKQHP